MPRYLFIVSRGNPALFEYAKQRFADDENIEVILDRRATPTPSAAPVERRRRPEVNEELRINSYALVTLP